MARPIVIVTDPGADDFVAILFALAAFAELDIAGVVAVAGNAPVDITQTNARRACELAGRADVPVYAGCAQSLYRHYTIAENAHGKSALVGLAFPEPSVQLRPQHGVDFLIETLTQADKGSVTLATLGPLTNVASAFARAPELSAQIQELVIMGGACFEFGNVTPVAEFNVYVDPVAAQSVLSRHIPITMIPLDLTHKVLCTPARIARISDLRNTCGSIVAYIMERFERGNLERFGGRGTPMHDPAVIAYLLRPSLFDGRHVNVAIESGGTLARGMTIVDWWGQTGRPANVKYMTNIDDVGFFDLLTEYLARLP